MAFALRLRYLNGWSMAAADGARKERAEWPPHPDRVFMALAAAWFETDEAPDEGEALRWLECLPPPLVAAAPAEFRTSVVSYVPVNDVDRGRKIPQDDALKKLKAAGLAILPEHRPRQARGFPVAIPRVPAGALPEARLIWEDDDPGPHRAALERLAAKVTHVGHSATFVQAWMEEHIQEDIPAAELWEPVEGIAATHRLTHRLRTPYSGRLDDLARACNRNAVLEYAELQAQAQTLKGKRRKQAQEEIARRFGASPPASRRPDPGRWRGYGKRRDRNDRAQETGGVFSPKLVILSLAGKRASLPATLKLTKALRGLLMKSCPDQPPPEWFSGHRTDGAPTAEPHLAIFPLAHAGREFADGRIMGLALALPDQLDDRDAARCLEDILYDPETGLPRPHRLFDGWIECSAELETREHPPYSLNADRWTRPSRVWASVTPVVLNRHPKGAKGGSFWERASEDVRNACGHVGLPDPREVLLHPVSLVEGVPHAREFPRMERAGGGGPRTHRHAVLVFDEPVGGPVLVGAGRFRGYGLCLPQDDGGAGAGK